MLIIIKIKVYIKKEDSSYESSFFAYRIDNVNKINIIIINQICGKYGLEL